MDGLGTVYGSARIDSLPAVLMGSHTDVMGGDWLDGALGFAYALEAARVRLSALCVGRPPCS